MLKWLAGAVGIGAGLLAASPSFAACTVTNILHNGDVADVAPVNTNFSDLASCAAPSAAPVLTGDVIINTRNVPDSDALQLNTPGIGQQALVILREASTNYWQYGKETNNNFILYDDTSGHYAINIVPNGNMSLMPSGGLVGIGTNAPGVSLDVQSSSATSLTIANFIAPSLAAGNQSEVRLGGSLNAGNSAEMRFVYQGDNSENNRYDIGFYGNATPVLSVIKSGAVGIGTPNPAFTLQVNGNGNYSSYAGTGGIGISNGSIPAEELYMGVDSSLGANGSGYIQSARTGTGFTDLLLEPNAGNVGIGTLAPNALLSLGDLITTIKVAAFDGGTSNLYGMGANTGELTFGAGISVTGTPQMVLTSAGNVGIGTTTPGSSLDVNGDINTAAGNSYKINGTPVLYHSSVNNSLAVGFGAGGSWVTSSTAYLNNVAVGSGAMHTALTSPTAYFNTAVGTQALYALTTGYYNTAVGAGSLANNPSGNNNTAVGLNALYLATAGNSNVAIGASTLTVNSGDDNVAVGTGAANGTTASYIAQGITAVGYHAGRSLNTGSDYSTLIGYSSGSGITTGARNVLIGPSTIGSSTAQVTTGSNNIAIGNDVAVPSATASNQLVIGNLIYGTGLSGTGTGVSGGNIGIGVTAPSARLSIKGVGTTTGINFQTTNSSGTSLVTMLDSGNVGIGTTTPDRVLTVSAATTPAIDLTTSSTTFLTIGGATSSNVWFTGSAVGDVALRGGGGNIFLGSATTAVAPTVTITPGAPGNVGIGTKTPDNLLTLSGASSGAAGSGLLHLNSTGTPQAGWSARLDATTFDLAFDREYSGVWSEALRIQRSTGSVGIGTASPASQLAITGTTPSITITDSSASPSAIATTLQNSGGALVINAGASHSIIFQNGGVEYGRFNATGSLSIGAASSSARLVVMGVGTTTGVNFQTKNSSGTALVTMLDNGDVGIGTASPAQALDVVGTIKQSGCTTAITLSADTSGNIICTPSDARLKNILGNYTGGLSEIARLTPKTFTFKPTSPTATKDFVHAGFIAQDIKSIIPQAVATQRNGYYSIDTTAILAASVNAIKALKTQNEQLRATNARLEIQGRALATKLTFLGRSSSAQKGELAVLKQQVAHLLTMASQRTAMK